jgi:hypothetical protein
MRSYSLYFNLIVMFSGSLMEDLIEPSPPPVQVKIVVFW